MSLALVVCLPMMFGGCAALNSVSRDVPRAPGYLRPAIVRKPAVGDDMVEAAAREREARVKNEKIINSARRDWNALSDSYKRGW